MAKKDEFDHLIREFRRLSYQDEGKWFSLPAWARFYLILGASLSTIKSDKGPFVVSLAVPTRTFVSLFIASGVLLARSLLSNEDMSEDLSRIKSLPTGTPVIIRDQNKKLKGIYLGFKEYQGNTVIGIKYEKGTEKWFSCEKAKRIEILHQESVRLPKHQSGRPVVNLSPLIKSVINNSKLDDYVLCSKQECLIIGPLNLLKNEINLPSIALRSDNQDRDNYSKGSIQDILRVRQFLPRNAAYRTIVLPARSKRVRSFRNTINPYLTVFDGANGLKWRGLWRSSNWVVILDRTERNFEIAIEQVNQEFVKYHDSKRIKLKIPKIPPGIEVMVYKVSK